MAALRVLATMTVYWRNAGLADEAKQFIIAVVDDDARVRDSIKDLLASAGFKANVYASAEEMLKADDFEVYCCLITDVRMPGIDGWELQRLALGRCPTLPTIFVTAHQDDVARHKEFDAGPFAILYKPFDGEELLEVLAAAIKQRQGNADRL